MANGYIVRRSIADGGPNGDTYAYVRVTEPFPNETIYHGNFRRVTTYSGQYDADEHTVYVPQGPITEEKYTGGGEQF
jgi:hypothetical protein